MRIAVSSGKGGTGKTTGGTNLAVTAMRTGRSVGYLDCDVKEPNGALFLKPQVTETRSVNVSIPTVDFDKCNGCGGCWLVCPTVAIIESYRQAGQLELGKTGDMHCVQGLFNIGEAMSPPVIAAVKAAASDADFLELYSDLLNQIMDRRFTHA